jgi:type IV pilus assembly protein PilW
MMMKKNKNLSSNQNGFTIVEIMVGLVIGMLATVVIMQVMTQFETQKRTTTGTVDAQMNGSIAQFNIGRELRMAGYPLQPEINSALECTSLTVDGVIDATLPNRLSPVSIIDGGVAAGASDSITIRYGSSSMGGISTQFKAIPIGNQTTVTNNMGCQNGDTSLIVNGASCNLTTLNVTESKSTTPTLITLANTTGALINANISCLGTWNEITYAVNNGNLERNGIPSVAGIVNLQAQYGISSTANSNQVIQWVDATGGIWSSPTVSDRNRIKAVRLAIVARNAKIESGVVSTACSSTTTIMPTGICAWEGSAASPAPTVNLNNTTKWDQYRYRVFDTIVPLRNMIWSSGTL